MGHMSARIEQLTAELAALTGEGAEEALLHALEERVSRLKEERRPGPPSPEEVQRRMAVIRRAQEMIAKLPVLDPRSADEIIGYNDQGHFD